MRVELILVGMLTASSCANSGSSATRNDHHEPGDSGQATPAVADGGTAATDDRAAATSDSDDDGDPAGEVGTNGADDSPDDSPLTPEFVSTDEISTDETSRDGGTSADLDDNGAEPDSGGPAGGSEVTVPSAGVDSGAESSESMAAGAQAEGPPPTFTPCTDRNCDLDAIRQILDANGHTEIDASAVVSSGSDDARVTTMYLVDLNHFGSLPGGVSVLPPEVGRLNALEELYLTAGSVSELPAEMANLTNLRRLDVIEQQLDHFPDVILELQNLESLALDGAPISELPPQLSNLTKLGSLWMNATLIEQLPDELTNMTTLHQMSFGSCRLTSLPANLGNLPGMNRLFLRGNQLTELPESITQLTPSDFSVRANRLCRVPESVANWLDEYAEEDWDEQQFSDADHTTPCEVVRVAQ